MKIDYISDIHLDYFLGKCSDKDEMNDFVERLKPNPNSEILIIAGDLSRNIYLSTMFFDIIRDKYAKIFIVFGNHDYAIDMYIDEKLFGNSIDKAKKMKRFWKNKYNDQVVLLDGDVVIYKDKYIGGACGWFNITEEDAKDLNTTYEDLNLYMKSKSLTMTRIKYNNDENGIYDYDGFVKIMNEKLDNVLKQNPNILITHFPPCFDALKKNQNINIFDKLYSCNNKINYKNINNIFAGHIHYNINTPKNIHINCYINFKNKGEYNKINTVEV